MKSNKLFERTFLRFFTVISCSFFLLACGGGKTEAEKNIATPLKTVSPNASMICVFSNDEETEKCQSGQIALFAPHSFGNEQLPVIFAAKYCDFNFQVVSTVGSVSCVFFKGRAFVKAEAAKLENSQPSVNK